MWTKGKDSNKGEWELTETWMGGIDEPSYHIGIPNHAHVKGHDNARLISLSPRMAEELLGQYTKNGNKWDSIHCDYYCECPEERNDLDDLLDELYKMKHGAE